MSGTGISAYLQADTILKLAWLCSKFNLTTHLKQFVVVEVHICS